MIDPSQTAGKVVVITVPPLASGQPGWQANRGLLTQRYANAAAVVVASLDAMPAEVRGQLAAPAPALRGQQMPGGMQALPQFLYTTGAMTQALLGAAPAGAGQHVEVARKGRGHAPAHLGVGSGQGGRGEDGRRGGAGGAAAHQGTAALHGSLPCRVVGL